MSYDIRKSSVHYNGRKVWGREYYHNMVPVLFTPYFEWSRKPSNWVSEFVQGVHLIYKDMPRIIRKQWYWEELDG